MNKLTSKFLLSVMIVSLSTLSIYLEGRAVKPNYLQQQGKTQETVI